MFLYFWMPYSVLNAVFEIRSAKNMKCVLFHIVRHFQMFYGVLNTIFGNCASSRTWQNACLRLQTFLDVKRLFKCCFWNIHIAENMKMHFSRFKTFLDVLWRSKYHFQEVRITENMTKCVFQWCWTFFDVLQRLKCCL